MDIKKKGTQPYSFIKLAKKEGLDVMRVLQQNGIDYCTSTESLFENFYALHTALMDQVAKIAKGLDKDQLHELEEILTQPANQIKATIPLYLALYNNMKEMGR